MFAATGVVEESQPSIEHLQQCRPYEYNEILEATNNFDESSVIGEGGFGKVYIGNVMNGSSLVLAAIKRLRPESSQGAKEFRAEVEMLSNLSHSHIVSLIGYCHHKNEMILLYKYMSNGTLEDYLHSSRVHLSWLRLLKICIGTARGLDYLHTCVDIDKGIIHGDVKSSNVLLHESWAAKVSDFGLSRICQTNQPSTAVCTTPKGTFGYLDPYFYTTGELSRKSDVYAYGVVLLEVLCGKPAVFGPVEQRMNLATWALQSIKEGSLKNIVDSGIMSQISPDCLKDFVRIADRCLHKNPKKRPTMAEVVNSLASVLKSQEEMNGSLLHACKTLCGGVVSRFLSFSNTESSAHGDSMLSSNNYDFTIRGGYLKVYKYDELKRATKNFSQDLVLGWKGFDETFIGWVNKKTLAPTAECVGFAVAVKRYKRSPQEAKTLVSILRRLAHPNIISLLGCCADNKNGYFFVYEHTHNQRFDHLLFGDDVKPLSWQTRVMVMIGVARALDYIHSSKVRVIHGDVKISNILLDQDFNVKLGGFELAKRAPRSQILYLTGGKKDIYGFGVILLETLTGQKALDFDMPFDKFELVERASPSLASRSKLKDIMDPRLQEKYPLKSAFQFAKLTSRCLAQGHKDRPSSEEILHSLEQIYALKE